MSRARRLTTLALEQALGPAQVPELAREQELAQVQVLVLALVPVQVQVQVPEATIRDGGARRTPALTPTR